MIRIPPWPPRKGTNRTFNGEPLPDGMTPEQYRALWVALTDWESDDDMPLDTLIERIWKAVRD